MDVVKVVAMAAIDDLKNDERKGWWSGEQWKMNGGILETAVRIYSDGN